MLSTESRSGTILTPQHVTYFLIKISIVVIRTWVIVPLVLTFDLTEHNALCVLLTIVSDLIVWNLGSKLTKRGQVLRLNSWRCQFRFVCDALAISGSSCHGRYLWQNQAVWVYNVVRAESWGSNRLVLLYTNLSGFVRLEKIIFTWSEFTSRYC